MKKGMVVFDPDILRKRMTNKISTYRDELLAAGFSVDEPNDFKTLSFNAGEKPGKSKFNVVGSFPNQKKKFITLSSTIDKVGNSKVYYNLGISDTWNELKDPDQLKKVLTIKVKKNKFRDKVKSKLDKNK